MQPNNGQTFVAQPLAYLAVAFCVGVLGARHFALPVSIVLVAALVTTFGALGSFIKKKLLLSTLFVLASMCSAGVLLAWIESNLVPPNQLRLLMKEGTISMQQPIEITGVLMREPEPAPNRLYLHLRAETIGTKAGLRKVYGSVVMLLPATGTDHELDQLELHYGARIRVMTVLERTDNFRNPGVSPFSEYLDRKGYEATAFVKSPLLIERLENTQVFVPLAWLYRWRRYLQQEIDASFSKESAGILDAAFLGNRYFLSDETSERFRAGGTFHVLVISGLHITLLGTFVFLIARRLAKSKSAQFFLSVTVVWGYSIAVGAEASVVRAALMFTLVLLGPIFARKAASLNALGAAALTLLVWRPSDLFDPSFQLTFVSVLAIVLLAWPMLHTMSAVGSWRLSRETPYPPTCSAGLRSVCECLFWSERVARTNLDLANYSYKLFKTPWAATLERYWLQGPLRYVFSVTVISVFVQIALVPFLVVYFHRLSLASFLLNIGVNLLMLGVAATAAMALLLTHLNPGVAAPFVLLTNKLNWLMAHCVDPFADIGVASIRLPEYTGWSVSVYVLYFVPLATICVLLSRWSPLLLPQLRRQSPRFVLRACRPLAVMVQLIFIAVIVFHPWSEMKSNGKLRVDFLDVGQGDSALITFPDNTTLLVDGGGLPGPFNYDDGDLDGTSKREARRIGETVVSEYLWWRGLDHVDYLLATHADADHIDGLNDVARNFSVRAALVARSPIRDVEYSKFSETMATHDVPIRFIAAGDVLRFGDVGIRVLWPLALTNTDAPSSNDDSIVLRVEFGERTFLLTGDIEASAEKAILQSGVELQADVVKVAHHGSRSSSLNAFVTSSRPRFAIISVGQTSVFGHPNREVVERWNASGSVVMTTGQSGAISVSTDGRDLELETFVRGGP